MFRRKKHASELKDIRELEKIIKLKDAEILNLKRECAEQFKLIHVIYEKCEFYNSESKAKEMDNIAKNNFDILLNDILDYKIKKYRNF